MIWSFKITPYQSNSNWNVQSNVNNNFQLFDSSARNTMASDHSQVAHKTNSCSWILCDQKQCIGCFSIIDKFSLHLGISKGLSIANFKLPEMFNNKETILFLFYFSNKFIELRFSFIFFLCSLSVSPFPCCVSFCYNAFFCDLIFMFL